MAEIGAIGDAVTGGLLARAAEPGAGEASAEGHTHEGVCLNCGALLTGDYCHVCGQRAHVHRTLSAFLHDLLHGVFHFEGKIWRTLPMLAWCPGQLTRRYIDGQRASFVSPIALFLFCVFLMFAVVSATGNLNPDFDANSKQNLAKAEQNVNADLAKLRGKRATVVAIKAPTTDLDERIQAKETELRVIRAMRGQGLTEAVLESPGVHFQSSLPWIEQAFNKAKSNPQLLIYKLKTNSYKWSWALIPLSVPFLWLMFPFSRRFRLYDHVVFVTYSQCFMSLLVVIGSAVAYVGAKGVAPFLLLIPPLHMFRQLRGAYSLSNMGALWRTAALMLVAVLVLSLFVLLIVALGALD